MAQKQHSVLEGGRDVLSPTESVFLAARTGGSIRGKEALLVSTRFDSPYSIEIQEARASCHLRREESQQQHTRAMMLATQRGE